MNYHYSKLKTELLKIVCEYIYTSNDVESFLLTWSELEKIDINEIKSVEVNDLVHYLFLPLLYSSLLIIEAIDFFKCVVTKLKYNKWNIECYNIINHPGIKLCNSNLILIPGYHDDDLISYKDFVYLCKDIDKLDILLEEGMIKNEIILPEKWIEENYFNVFISNIVKSEGLWSYNNFYAINARKSVNIIRWIMKNYNIDILRLKKIFNSFCCELEDYDFIKCMDANML